MKDLEELMMSREGGDEEITERLRRNLRLACVRELTPKQKEVLRLRYEEGKSARQIAKEQGVHPTTVQRTLARAENKLRRCLQYSL
ncbi:MAG: sigma-70 family RNA polymerase sigma factor [Oscillospiraceae bacterium]|nr:sigma-70 family RNA polymerase sigma factor [Oscillospiraceae bacterium]